MQRDEPGPPAGGDDEPTWRIDCEQCVMRASEVCGDCVVTFLCERDERGATVVDVEEVRVLRLLQRGGLAPALRHRQRTG